MLDEDDLREIGIQNSEHVKYFILIRICFYCKDYRVFNLLARLAAHKVFILPFRPSIP